MKAFLAFLVTALVIFPGLDGFCQELPLRLSVESVSALALNNNLDIQIAELELEAARTRIAVTRSVFDTILSANASYTDDQSKKSSTIFGSKALTNEYSVGLSKHLPTGTDLSLNLEDERVWTDSDFATINPSHDAKIQAGIGQPLGRNFFGFLDRSAVRLTILEIKALDNETLDRVESFLASAQNAYWLFALRQEEAGIKKEMLESAKELKKLYQQKADVGLVEDVELFAIEALVLRREADVLAAYDLLNIARVGLLLAINAEDKLFVSDIHTLDDFSSIGQSRDFYEMLKIAVENRRDYKAQKLLLKGRDISLAMAENSLWPEIDLTATFERNGLDQSFSKAVKSIADEDNPSFSLGVSFSMPLENTQARAQLRQAEAEKAGRIARLKQTEKNILGEIHQKVKEINLAIGRVITYRRIAQLEEDKLKSQVKRFNYGRSDFDTLIRYQDDLLSARLNLAAANYGYHRASIELSSSTDTLLDDVLRQDL